MAVTAAMVPLPAEAFGVAGAEAAVVATLVALASAAAMPPLVLRPAALVEEVPLVAAAVLLVQRLLQAATALAGPSVGVAVLPGLRLLL